MYSLCLCTALLLGQAATGAEDLAARVRAQVRLLNSDELTARDAAQQALIKLGPAALSHLPQADARTPADVAVRLGQVRQALLVAQSVVTGQASLVTLDVDTQPLDQVIAAINKQTGNQVVDHRGEFGEETTNPKLTLKLSKVPFWEAIDKLCDEAELTVYGFAGRRGVYLVNKPKGQLPRTTAVSISGPFRIQASRFEATRDLQNREGESLKLMIDVSWEPRISPILISQPLDEVRATGNGGELIAVVGAEGEPEASVEGETTTVELPISLSLPPRSVAKIASLKGRLKTLVPGQVETFKFDKLPVSRGGQVNRVEQRKAGVTVIVDMVRKNQEVWEVRMRVRLDEPQQALESHRGWMFGNEAYLIGADGKKIEPGGFEQTRQTRDEFGIMYLFDLQESPEKLSFVYRTPTSILEVPVSYELKDLDLP